MDFSIPQKYDTLAGRPVRDMRANDIVTIGTTGTVGCIGSTFASLSTTITSSQELYIINFYAMTTASAELNIQYGTGNTSTLLSFYLAPDTPLTVNANLDSPIAKITGASTISIRGSAGQTACIWMSGVRYPVWSSVETA
jgi:hypothetical protein